MSQVTQILPYYGYAVYGQSSYNTHIIQIYDGIDVNDTFTPDVIMQDHSNSVIYIYRDIPRIAGIITDFTTPILFAADKPKIIMNNAFSDDKPKIFPYKYDMTKPHFI
jgi:hypothetical protein